MINVSVAPGKTRFALTAALLVAGVLAAGQFAKIAVPITLLMERFPDKGAGIGFLVSVLSVIGVLAGAFFGAFLARVGFRKPMIMALLLGAAMSVVQVLPLSFPLFIASRALEGLSHLIIVVAAPTLIGQICAPEHKAIGLTIWSTVFGIAFALFTWAGLPFVAQFGLSALFIMHGGFLLCVCVAIWKLLPSGIVPRSHEPLTFKRIWARHMETYSSAWICAPALGWFFYAAGFVALVTVMPLYFPPDTPAFVRGLLPLLALVVSLTVGLMLVRRAEPILVTICGFCVAALCAGLMLTGLNVALVSILVLSAMGLVQSGTFSSIPVLISSGDHQALANGAMAQMGNAGNLVGTPLLLWLTSVAGVPGAVGFTVILFGLGALVHLWLAVLRRRA